MDNDPFPVQGSKCFAHRPTADAETFGNCRLDQPFAGTKGATEYCIAYPQLDTISQVRCLESGAS